MSTVLLQQLAEITNDEWSVEENQIETPRMRFDWAASHVDRPNMRDHEGIGPTTRLRLITIAADGSEARLGIQLDTRLTADGEVHVSGTDRSGSLRVRLISAGDPPTLRFHFDFTPGAAVSPNELVSVLNFLDALSSADTFGISFDTTGRWLAAPQRLTNAFPRIPATYSDLIRQLATLERLAKVRLTMPATVSPVTARSVHRAVLLLSGEELTAQWASATLIVDEVTMQWLRQAESGSILEVATDLTIDVGNGPTVVGIVEHVFRQAKVAEVTAFDDQLWSVRLVPGSDDTVESRVVPSPANPPDRQVPLEAYSGRWIAQHGNEVVAVADSAHALVAELRRTGAHGSIWRVPASREEAEAVTWA